MPIRLSRELSDRRKSDTSRLRARTKVFTFGVIVGVIGGPRILEFFARFDFLF